MNRRFLYRAACLLSPVLLALGSEQNVLSRSTSGNVWPTLMGRPALIIGHRGERAYMPEHTLGSYHLAMYNHVDFVEPDLVLTKDGVPVAYHDLCIKSNTDVADHPEFAHRKRTLRFNDTAGSGGWMTFEDDWCIFDFTLAELQTLKVKVNPRGKTSMRPPYFNNLFTIPTFQEFLDLVHNVSSQIGRTFGIIPELKHCYFHSKLRPEYPRYFEDKALAMLEANGYPRYGPIPNNRGPVVIQNFEVESAKYLRSRTDKDILQLMYLNPRLVTPNGLDEVAGYATYVGFMKEFYTIGADEVFRYLRIPYDHDEVQRLGGFISAKDLSQEVKKRRFAQTPYTFYSGYEQSASSCQLPGGCSDIVDRRKELLYFFSIGVDGLFTEVTTLISLLLRIGRAVSRRSDSLCFVSLVKNNIEALQLRTEFQGMLDIQAGTSVITPTVNYTRSLSKRAAEPHLKKYALLERTRKELAAVHMWSLTKVQH